MTTGKLQEILDDRFGGVLSKGRHDENGEGCALEILSVALDKTWTDNPDFLRTFDLRPINDIDVTDEIRTKYLLPVLAAYAGSLDWPLEKQKTVVSKIVVLTVNRIISALPDLPESISVQCKNASTLDEAGNAAEAAETTKNAGRAAGEAAGAARTARSVRGAAETIKIAATRAADSAATAASRSGGAWEISVREKIFILACEIWMDALKEPK